MANNILKHKLDKLESKVDALLLEANPNIQLDQIPLRPLKPGMSSTIVKKKTSPKERDTIGNWVGNHTSDSLELERLKRRLAYGRDYDDMPLSPKDREKITKQIKELELELSGQSYGYDKIIQYIVPIIKSRCSDYLPDIQSTGFLYRGIKDAEHKNRLAFRGHSRTNRYPKDSDPIAQELIDEAMLELGIAARRSNSVFCSGNDGQAKNYGALFLFFPCNGSTFSWSRHERDMLIKTHELSKFRQSDPEADELIYKIKKYLQMYILDEKKVPDEDYQLYTFYHNMYNDFSNNEYRTDRYRDVLSMVERAKYDENISVFVFTDDLVWCKRQKLFESDRFIFNENLEKFS